MEGQFKLNFESAPDKTDKTTEDNEKLFGLDEETLSLLDADDHLDQYKDRR